MEGNGSVQSCIDLHFGISAIFSYSYSSNRICLFVCLTVLMELLVTIDFNLFVLNLMFYKDHKEAFSFVDRKWWTNNSTTWIICICIYSSQKMMCWFFVCLFHGIVVQHQGPEHSIQVL